MVCFDSLHRKGSRAHHTKLPMEDVAASVRSHCLFPRHSLGVFLQEPESQSGGASAAPVPSADVSSNVGETRGPMAEPRAPRLLAEKDASDYPRFSPEWFVERAKYIPVRLNLSERKKVNSVAFRICQFLCFSSQL